jgi:hypothetical protein
MNGIGNNYVDLDEYINTFLSLKIGDTVKFLVKENNPGIDTYSLNPNSRIYYIIRGAIIPYEISNIIPKIKQSDFIKDIMFRLGVVSQYDAKKRTLTLDKFQKVEDNKRDALDWTNKIDLSKDIDINFTKVVESYFKTSFVRYKEDDKDVQLRLFKTVAKLGLGDGQINIDNDNLTDEGDVFKSVYSATKDVFTFPLSGTDFKFYLPYVPVYFGGEEQDLQPRILIANRETQINTFSNSFTDITFSGGGTYSNIGYAYFAKQRTNISSLGIINPLLDNNLFTLSFQNLGDFGPTYGLTYIGNALLQKNYNLYQKILNNPILLPIYLNLKDTDIQDADFLRPIYLDFSLDSGYYYLEEISQYKGDGTKCNLVKI